MFGTGPKKPAIPPGLADILAEPGAQHLLYSWHALAERNKETAIRIIDTLEKPASPNGTNTQ